MSKKDKDNIEAEIESIDNVSQSQIDRLRLKDELDERLYDFCKEKINSSIENNPIKEKAKLILDRYLSEADGKELSLNQVLAILDHFDKHDNDIALGILKLATEKEKANTQILIQNGKAGVNDNPNAEKEQPLTKEVVADAKEAIDKINNMGELLNLIEQNEFNKSEKK